MSAAVSSIVSAAATTLSSPAATSTTRASSQGGIIDGANPTKYNPKDPIILFIVQAVLIVSVCHILHWPLSKIRQPRVIAEVVGGILLGPSVMGRVPGFRQTIFPDASLPNLSTVANLGLILYLFLIGLETDVRFLISNWRVATSVAVAGLAIPFGVGCALAYGVYRAFHDDQGLVPIKFEVYMLFIGIAVAITAFPVLCRILTELKLLDTNVGVITLSAGVANDVVGWILLALCVALVNAGSGLNSLWILLTASGFMLLLLIVVKPALFWLLRRNGSLEHGPSQSIISLILLIALASAFFTGIIGIHPIFGGFMTGLVIPRQDRFNIRVTEKLEDLIGALFLPLYFTLSGLNTNLGLLDSGAAWGYVFATTFAAFFSKIIGASLAARFSGLVWRESFTIGVLMSCKGLVELIVLNIGLQANILSTRTFTIFVVMALLTTFATTPIVSVLYPPWYQRKIAAWRRGEIDWDSGAPVSSASSSEGSKGEGGPGLERVSRLLVYLRLDNMPSLLRLLSMFGDPSTPSHTAAPSDTGTDGIRDAPTTSVPRDKAVWAHGIRLLQLTDRDSSVMTVAQVDDYSRHDPVVNTFRTVGQLHNLSASGEVAIMPETRFAEALIAKSYKMASDLLLVPWTETGDMSDSQIVSSTSINDKISSSYGSFVKSVLESHDRNVAVFFSRSDPVAVDKAKSEERARLMRQCSSGALKEDLQVAPGSNEPYHIFLVYLGDEDDRLALRLVIQLCEKSKATATILRARSSVGASNAVGDALFEGVLSQLPESVASRVSFRTEAGSSSVEELLQYATAETKSGVAESKAGPKLVVLGRRVTARLDEGKLTHRSREDLVLCLGSLAGNFVAGGVRADLLVVQAKAAENTS
ncbi:K(+)/H(+) antiporter 1 [Metarhizium album ARSEF 1941]|uniref:K(+)/H(+) antiporter 1 n=1 Tax=Metarhizium album (strain ARSEF 1941) TaxID=1081103 RepID=A0A0B2WPN4_METAS|nr:K(+)/H(+) antiporter 1 [Metarhizium album ARSEF 1941]KHN95978.1 K(+)/H(+) antiporter 1 [Metarhizium album ARSEF 1941]